MCDVCARLCKCKRRYHNVASSVCVCMCVQDSASVEEDIIMEPFLCVQVNMNFIDPPYPTPPPPHATNVA